jgi:hypothetical protein
MKWNEVEPSAREAVRSQLLGHFEVLRTNLTNAGTQAMSYLLLINSGAAVALMAFMGTSARVRSLTSAWWSLGAFVLGVVLVGVAHAFSYHVQLIYFRTWAEGINSVFRKNKDIDDLHKSLEPTEKKFGSFPTVAAYAAFLSFMVGAVIAGSHFSAFAADASGTVSAPATLSAPSPEPVVVAPGTIASAPEFGIGAKLLTAMNDDGEGITGVATLLLVLVTGGLVWLARQQNRTTRAQLRAYVMVEAAEIGGIKAGCVVTAAVSVKNFGQTPAYKFHMTLGMGTAPTFPELGPRSESPHGTLGVLAPGGQFQSRAQSPAALSVGLYDSLVKGDQSLFVYGEINYDDAFGKRRTTLFRTMIGGSFGLGPQLVSCSEGNEAT